jgi:predicted PurR-regulated permease PerM
MHKEHSASNLDQLIRIALITALAYWSFLLILPFFGILAWSVILAVALYPVYKWFCTRLGSPVLAATLVTLISLLVVVGSLLLLTNNMFSTVSDLTTKIRANELIIPQPPDAVKGWPLVGEQIHQAWSSASTNMGAMVNQYASYLLDTGKFLLGKTAHFTFELILFIISVLFSGYLLSQSGSLITSINKLAERVAPKRGVSIINIMNDTIQNVSRGVIGLSLFQAVLMGLLLLIAGVPGAGLISFIALLLCIAQLGLFLLVVPVIAWLFFTKSFLFALVISILLSIDALLDNFLKPFILARGLQTPMLVIFLGVFGGVIAHGVIGIFLGPVLLAIFYDLINHWLTVSD